MEDENRRRSHVRNEATERAGGDAAERILHSYRDLGVNPNTSPNSVMIVGTGGIGLWEREWQQAALEGTPEDDVKEKEYELYRSGDLQHGIMRAMCFAKDEAWEFITVIQDFRTSAFRFTSEGRRRRENFNSARREIGQKEMDEHSDPTMEHFMEVHPDNWREVHRCLHDAATARVEFGMQLLVTGMTSEDKSLIETGQNLMAASVQWLRERMEHPEQLGAEIQPPWPTLGRNASQLAKARQEHIRSMAKEISCGNTRLEHDALEFLTRHRVAHDLTTLTDQNVSFLTELGSKNGGLPSILRNLSDETFDQRHANDNVITTKTVETLAHGGPEETEATYAWLGEIQEAIVAVAFWDYHSPEIDYKEQPKHLYQMKQRGATQQEMEAHLRAELGSLGHPNDGPTATDWLNAKLREYAEHHLQKALGHLEPAISDQWTPGSKGMRPADLLYYHYNTGMDLAAVTRQDNPALVALEMARSHPEWESFIRGEIAYYYR